MKEKYFTYENIIYKSEEIKKEMEISFKHPKFSFQKDSCALLIMDMQNYFAQKTSHAFIPSMEAIIPNIIQLYGRFKEKNLPIIFTKHVNTEQNAFLMNTWWKSIIKDNSKDSHIIEDFCTNAHFLIKKNQYDAFYNTGLQDTLQGLDVDSLVITGVMAHLCCETTARSAFVRGFKTFFAIDGTASYNEIFHRNTIINLSHGFSVPVLTQDILDKLL